MSIKYIIVFILICYIKLSKLQSILFPHGYFDSNKISAVDAFYLHMLALESLEHGGVTEKELDDLVASRKEELPDENTSLQKMIEKIKNNPNPKAEIESNEEEKVEDIIKKERPLTTDNRPSSPFKIRVLRDNPKNDNDDDDDDDGFNPFEDIATRAPPTSSKHTVGAPTNRLLNRNQILGISPHKPQYHIGIPHEGEMSEKGWKHPRRRKPYIKLDLSVPQIVQLPIPSE